MIRGVLFDYGGVVADGGNGAGIAKRLCEHLELPQEAASEVFMPLFKQFIRGKIDSASFWQSVEKQTNTHVSEEQRHTWDDWWGVQPYPEMADLIAKLKAAGYPVGLLSNIIPPAKTRIEAGGGYSLFDFALLSSEVGYAKPDPEFYQLGIDNFNGLAPEEIVFIEDQERYTQPAEALGMRTILATSSEQIISELQKLGLPV